MHAFMPRKRGISRQWVVVVIFVGVQLLRTLPQSSSPRTPDRLDLVYESPEVPRVVDVGRREDHREREVLSVRHELALRARFSSIPIPTRVVFALDASSLRGGSEGVSYRVDRGVHKPGHHEVP